MEGICRSALVYFENASPLEKDRMMAKFLSMDLDDDGQISKHEFLESMKEDMPTSERAWLFTELDQDVSGSLDYHEFKTYYYAIICRPVCDCCKKLLVEGTHYCCVQCREMHMSDGHELYQVCEQCYSNKMFKHDDEHTEFLDNHVLFQSMEISAPMREKPEKEKQMEAAFNAGRSYYLALSSTEKNVASSLFREMDRDDNKKVSVNEVISFLTDKGMTRAYASQAFEDLGLAGNDDLSMEDVVALWYIFVIRPNCYGCESMIMGMYYSCVVCDCRSTNGADTDTYDLCPECYSSGMFQHEHDFFLDNFVLLRMKNQLALKREKRVKENPEAEAVLEEACLYYEALPDAEKQDAYYLFAKMDSDANGEVSVNEAISYLTEKGIQWTGACKVIQGMGLAGYRNLSIKYVGALWYISMMRPCCASCGQRFMGTYYSCVACHDKSVNGAKTDTYDLCFKCYRKREFRHHHDRFFDNFVLLRMRNHLEQVTVMSSSGGGQGHQDTCRRHMRRILKFIVPHAVQAALGVAVTAACSIM